MKRLIFTILIAVATVSMLRAQEPTSPEAIPSSRLQDSLSATPVPTTVPVIEELPAPTFYADLSDSSASMPTSVSPVRRKQRFLPMKRRIDREINKIKFAYAGEIALGLTVSYGTLSSDDTDYLLILDNLNLNGSIFTINPSVGYFFKDNMSAGVRFGYTNINGTLDTGNFNLGEQNDVNLAFKNLHLQSSALSVGLYFRSYAGLDSKGHFGLFGEVDLSMKTGNSEFTYETEGTLRSTFSDDLKLSLGFNPGLAVYIFPNVCSTIPSDWAVSNTPRSNRKMPTATRSGNEPLRKCGSGLNLLNIRIGVTVHLLEQEANKHDETSSDIYLSAYSCC